MSLGRAASPSAQASAPPSVASAPPSVSQAVGPAWTRGEMEKPAGVRDMGGWSAVIYTEEQQLRLNVDDQGNARQARRSITLPTALPTALLTPRTSPVPMATMPTAVTRPVPMTTTPARVLPKAVISTAGLSPADLKTRQPVSALPTEKPPQVVAALKDSVHVPQSRSTAPPTPRAEASGAPAAGTVPMPARMGLRSPAASISAASGSGRHLRIDNLSSSTGSISAAGGAGSISRLRPTPSTISAPTVAAPPPVVGNSLVAPSSVTQLLSASRGRSRSLTPASPERRVLGSRQGSPIGIDRCGFKFVKDGDGHLEFLQPMSSEVSAVLSNLAAIVQERRQMEQAEQLQREVLELMRAKLAPEQVDSLLAKSDLQEAVRRQVASQPSSPTHLWPPLRTPPRCDSPDSPGAYRVRQDPQWSRSRSHSPMRIPSPQLGSPRLSAVASSVLSARSTSPSMPLLASASCVEVPKVLEQSNGRVQERRVLMRVPNGQTPILVNGRDQTPRLVNGREQTPRLVNGRDQTPRLVNGQDRRSLGASQESSRQVLQMTEICGPPQRSRLSEVDASHTGLSDVVASHVEKHWDSYDYSRGDARLNEAMADLQNFHFASGDDKPLSQGDEPESVVPESIVPESAAANGESSSAICHESSRSKIGESIASSPSMSAVDRVLDPGLRGAASLPTPIVVIPVSGAPARPVASNGNESSAAAAVPLGSSVATLTPAPLSPADSQAEGYAPIAEARRPSVNLGSSLSGSEEAAQFSGLPDVLPVMERAQARTRSDGGPGALAAMALGPSLGSLDTTPEGTAAPAAPEVVEIAVQPPPSSLMADVDPFDGFRLTPLNAQPFQAISNIARKAKHELVERLTPRNELVEQLTPR